MLKLWSEQWNCKLILKAVIHAGAVSQSARIIEMPKVALRTGDQAEVTMEFTKQVEWLAVGTKFIFRDGCTKAIGTISGEVYIQIVWYKLCNTMIWW